jgi:hypothetical protein
VKFIRVFHLGAIGAVVAMALVGAGSAAATALCEEAPKAGACTGEKTFEPEAQIQATATSPFLVTNGEDVNCESSKATLKGKTIGAAGVAAKGTVTALSFSGCKLTGGATCTVESVNTPYLAEVSWTSGSNGTLAIKDNGGGKPGAAVSCAGGLLACVFSAEPSLGVEGGNPAAATASKVAMSLSTKEGFTNCPKEAQWSATYKTTSPAAVYVANESTPAGVLCKEATSPCPFAGKYPAGQEIAAEATAPSLKNSVDTIGCGKSTLKIAGKTAGSGTEPATGQVQSLGFFECKMKKLGTSCTLTAINLPYKNEFDWVSVTSGTLTIKKSSEGGDPQVTVKCGVILSCIYSVEGPLAFEGGNPAKFSLPEAQLKPIKAVGFETCPKEANWEKVSYQVSTPAPLFLTRR